MILAVGSKGEDVKRVQAKLGLKADGIFGPKTEAAVKKWQTENGLAANGVLKTAAWNKMFPINPAIDINKLKKHIPAAVLVEIPDVMEKFEINTPLRLCHFLAQCAHESINFKATQENLNYNASGLLKIFKKYFPTEAKAKEYERKPEKIANLVYGNRMDNGPETSGDGFRYRGRGFIQLTGKVNYTAFNNTVPENVVANPELVATKYPLLSAAWFWNSRSLNVLADKGSSDAVVTEITKKVNGGTNGLSDRLKHFKEYMSLLA